MLALMPLFHCFPFGMLYCLSKTVFVHFLEVMNNTEQQPLVIHLSFTAKAKTIKSNYMTNMGKWRFRRGYSSGTNGLAKN